MSSVNVNMQTLADARQIGRTQDLLGRALARLSSGYRIVEPADDPTGTGMAERLDAQTKRVSAASTNVQNTISYLQSSDSFMATMGNALTRMSELSTLAKDVMKNSGDVGLYESEFKQIQDQLRVTIGGTTAQIGGTYDITKPLGSFNGNVLFGPNAAGMTIAVGQAPGQTITLPENNLRDGAMLQIIQQDSSGNYLLNVSDPTSLAKAGAAIQDLSNERATVGAFDSRLTNVAASLTTESQNLSSTLSRIQDVDVAAESTRLTKYQLLSQGSTAILAQANQTPKEALQLLQA